MAQEEAVEEKQSEVEMAGQHTDDQIPEMKEASSVVDKIRNACFIIPKKLGTMGRNYVPFWGPVNKEEEEKLQAELEIAKAAFRLFDKDRKGCITWNELRTIMRVLGYHLTKAELLNLIQEVDVYGNGTIGFPKLLKLMATKIKDIKKADLCEAFRVSEDDDTGFILVDSLQSTLEKVREDISDEEVDDMIGEEDKKVRINMDEPVSEMTPWKYLPFFRREDKVEEEKKLHVKWVAGRLTDEQFCKFEEVFSSFDKNGDGCINIEELGAVMGAVGQYPTEAELLDMIEEFDPEGNGAMGFPEFLGLMATKVKDTKWKEDLYEAFRVYDTDGTGFISVDVLRGVLEKLGEDLSDEEVDDMIREADTEGNGLINYKDFVKVMTEG